jgi:peptidoglycan/xylan/chitin deacetylase (PgdA/CDA1 family)
MSAWLDKLRQALDRAPQPVAFFCRDDDAGWHDDRLLELLDLFARYAMPIDVAAIPGALTSGLAAELRARLKALPERVAIHQHGFSHRNHEPEGRRKCEFGIARGRARQQSDIEQGKSLLEDLFGTLVSPIFTPPWNRCTSVTGECLMQAGIRILSRDRSATPLCLDGLVELPVNIDWFARARGVRLSLDELGQAIASAVKTSAPVGIMFHHALMDETERGRAGELLALLASHHNAQCCLMYQLVTNLSQDMKAQVPGHAGAWPQLAMPASSTAERKSS